MTENLRQYVNDMHSIHTSELHVHIPITLTKYPYFFQHEEASGFWLYLSVNKLNKYKSNVLLI